MRVKSRRDQLLTQPVGNELVIYDERSHAAHRLNATAAQVWRLADGERSVQDLAAELRETLGAAVGRPASEELVRRALTELDRAELLVQRLPALAEPMTRREMLVVTAALVPVVTSIVAPTPAMAQTPRPGGFVVLVTATYRHLGPGRTVVCVETATSPAQPNVEFSLTLTGPLGPIRRTPDLENGRDRETFEISVFGDYTAAATITAQGFTGSGSATVQVTATQGTCPEGFIDD